eukprot:1192787-Karenia_brevis.AAC.1
MKKRRESGGGEGGVKPEGGDREPEREVPETGGASSSGSGGVFVPTEPSGWSATKREVARKMVVKIIKGGGERERERERVKEDMEMSIKEDKEMREWV